MASNAVTVAKLGKSRPPTLSRETYLFDATVEHDDRLEQVAEALGGTLADIYYITRQVEDELILYWTCRVDDKKEWDTLLVETDLGILRFRLHHLQLPGMLKHTLQDYYGGR